MTDQPDFTALLRSIRRCNASYIVDDAAARAAFMALGYIVIARYSDDAHQAVIWRHPIDGMGLTITGTRFSEGCLEIRISDLFQDVDFLPLDLGGNLLVAGKVYQAARKIYDWAARHLGPTDAFDIVEGHSKGGWQATYAVLYLQPTQVGKIIAWEPPKQGNDVFWTIKADALLNFLQIAHGRDPWFGYPPSEVTDLNHGKGQILWIADGGKSWSWVTEESWIGGDLIEHEDDHGPTSVIVDVENLLTVMAEA